MRKTVAMLLAMAMTVSLTACGGGENRQMQLRPFRQQRDQRHQERRTTAKAAEGKMVSSVRRFHNDSWTRPAGRKSPLSFLWKSFPLM